MDIKRNKKEKALFLILMILTVLLISITFNSCANDLLDLVEKDILTSGPVPTYTVTYYGNGSNNGEVPIDLTRYKEGDTVIILDNVNNLEKTGYVFSDWNSEAEGTGTFYVPTTPSLEIGKSNVKLYAWWDPDTYTIAFDPQEGSTPDPVTKSVSFDDPYGILPTTSRAAYTFAGWWTEPGGTGQNVTSSTILITDSDHTLYAYWINLPIYTVSFNSQGGTVVNSQDVIEGNLALVPTEPTRAGYTFDGWYKESSCLNIWDFPTETVTEVITLYAKWDVNSYTLTFDAQGGTTPDPISKEVFFNSVYENLSTTSKPGFIFNGWWTGQDGTGTEVTASTVVAIASNHTIYANWNWEEYALRDTGPAGGWIFYINPNANTDGWKYMEAASTNESNRYWGTNPKSVSGADGSAIGTGLQNTIDIVNGDTFANKAADICYNKLIDLGGYIFDDWFLPSKDELNQMFVNLDQYGIGEFVTYMYWSSSEYANNEAWRQSFGLGTQDTYLKSTSYKFRAIRMF